MRTVFISLLLATLGITASSQTIGGSSVFHFLNLPNCPQLTALGGVNISNITSDIAMTYNNPALLRNTMHGELATVFNSMYAGIKNYHATAGYFYEKWQTNFSLGISYLNYGSIPQTDAAGNELGIFRPGDYVVQISASRNYLEKWHYGASLKFITSNYGFYKSNGVAMDAGACYYDSVKQMQVSLVMKNMGFQLRQYEGSRPDDLPFDLQVGITKRLEKAPLQFSITAHHLHQFNIRYNDTAFNNENEPGIDHSKKYTIDKLFRHFVFATQVYITEKVEVTAAYNHLRGKELRIANTTNGLTGISMGIGILFRKIQLRYARAYYQNNTAYNQFGVNLKLSEMH